MSPTLFRYRDYRFFFFSREEERMRVHVSSADGEANPPLQGEGNYVAGKRYDDAAQAFAAQPERVQKAAREAAPRNRQEAKEMWEAEAVGLSKAKR